MPHSETLVEVELLKKYFPVRRGLFRRKIGDIKAVDDISFSIQKGEAFGLVGESGSGKSTIGRTIVRLYNPTGGAVFYKGMNIHQLSKNMLQQYRASIQLIFQDPYESLNPKIPIGDAIGEALVDHGLATKKEAPERVMEVLEVCGLTSRHMDCYPHEFSDGQRQRACIAKAILMNPDFVIADEPVSDLDGSTQAQIINLFRDLQTKKGLTYLFFSHDLSEAEHLCSTIGVLYLGSMVELAPKEELFTSPLHPYTQALISAIPIPNPTIKRERIVLAKDIPYPSNPPAGCKFHIRCPLAKDICSQEVPAFHDVGNGHFVACHLV